MSRVRLPDDRLPDGPYRLRIVRAAAGRSRAGHPAVRVLFEIAVGVHAGRRFTQGYSLLPQAIWRLRRLCAAAGAVLHGGDLDTRDLEAAVIEADVRCAPCPDGPPLFDVEHERPAPATPDPA